MKSSHLNNLFSKLLKKVPLMIIFTVPFMIEIFIIVGLVGFLSYKNGKEAVNEIAVQLREEITVEIQEYIKNQLSALVMIHKLNADAIERGELSLDLQERETQKYHYLWQMIKIFDGVSRIGLSSQHKNQYLEIWRKPKNGELRFVVSNASTNYFTFEYAISPQGQPTKVTNKFTDRPYDPRKRPWYIRPLAKKIYVIIKYFKFNPLELTHNYKLLTTNYNADHNGGGDSDNDSTIF